MTKLQTYLDATARFAPNTPYCRATADDLRRWTRGEAENVRDLCPTRRLRCFAYVTTGIDDAHLVSVEFAAPDDSYYSILIRCGGSHDVSGRTPCVADLAAGIKLLALLADELNVNVRLQP